MAVDVLIAEDEPGILESLEFILRRAGWTICTATDGDATLRAVEEQSPRMIVLDVMLPKRSGFEILRLLRSSPATADIPILMLTAKGQQLDRRTAEELGASAFITKPYSNAEVVETVAALLKNA